MKEWGQNSELEPDMRVESQAAKGARAVALGQTARIKDQTPAEHAMKKMINDK